jgi:hypothetical protein
VGVGELLGGSRRARGDGDHSGGGGEGTAGGAAEGCGHDNARRGSRAGRQFGEPAYECLVGHEDRNFGA